jgi:hypothetical protein
VATTVVIASMVIHLAVVSLAPETVMKSVAVITHLASVLHFHMHVSVINSEALFELMQIKRITQSCQSGHKANIALGPL